MQTKYILPIKLSIKFRGKDFDFKDDKIINCFEQGSVLKSQYNLVKEIDCDNYEELTLCFTCALNYVNDHSNDFKAGLFSKIEANGVLFLKGITKYVEFKGDKTRLIDWINGYIQLCDKNNIMVFYEDGKLTREKTLLLLEKMG